MDERASGTARVIARSLARAHAEGLGGDLVSARTAALARAFLRASRGPRARALEASAARLTRCAFEALTIPGLALQYALRKRWIEERVRAALDDGAARLVVLGAGFDPLAASLALERAPVRLLEVDHPATQAAKRRALEALGLASRVELLSLDLERRSLIDALAARPTVERDLRAVFVAEGLLMYLAPETAAGLLRGLRCCAPPGSEVVFSVMEPDPEGALAYRSATRLARAWLRWRGEPLRWGIARAELPALLARLGLELVEVADAHDLRRGLDAPGRVAEGELVVRARLV